MRHEILNAHSTFKFRINLIINYSTILRILVFCFSYSRNVKDCLFGIYIFISLIMSDIKHLFKTLVIFGISPFQKLILNCCCCFVLLFYYERALYILEINSLSISICFVSMLSFYSVGCVFHFVIFFAEWKHLRLLDTVAITTTCHDYIFPLNLIKRFKNPTYWYLSKRIEELNVH